MGHSDDDSRDDGTPDAGRERPGAGGPVPPHERTWRHPAEVGEWSREQMRVVAAPPPLSRRLTAVIAGTSVALSAAVLLVSVPRLDDARDASPATTITDGLRGTPTSAVATESPVDALPAGWFSAESPSTVNLMVASAEDVGSALGSVVSVGDESLLDATVIHVDELLGIALLEVAEQVAGFDSWFEGESPAPKSGDEVVIDDGSGGPVIGGRVGVGTARDDGLVPLDADRNFRGVRLVFATDGRLLGLAVRHHHATWLVTSDRLSRLLDAAGVSSTRR